jgi:regulator of RNase E activity RraB
MSSKEKKEILPPYSVKGYEQTGSYTVEDEADRKVFRQLLELGADLDNERHTIHYLYFATEEGADEACRDLESIGFDVTAGEKLESEPSTRKWPVKAERIEIINEEVIRSLRKPLAEIAEKHGGEYDGWEAAAG